MQLRYIALLAFTGAMVSVLHAEDGVPEEPASLAPDITIGPIKLSPSVHFDGAIGDSSGEPEQLAVGHHDPTREEGTVQGIEAGLSLRAGPIEGYAVHTFAYGADEDWGNAWEEAFIKLKDIPGGFELRGGRTLTRFGQHNAKHLHSWDFADMPLVWGRLFGDDGLITDGGDITWLRRGLTTTFGITAGYGEALAHDHDHGHGGHDDHDDHDDHDGHAGHVEEARFADGLGFGRAFTQFHSDDFNAFEAGVSLAIGEDEATRQLVVAGADFSYTWRENGLEPGGRAVKWLTEVLYRDIEDGDAEHDHDDHDEDHDHEDHDDHDDHDDHGAHEEDMLPGGSDWGLYSQVVYTHNRHLDAGVRLGFVEGDEGMGSGNRLRVSPAITTYLDPYRRVMLRGQYNFDEIQRGQEAHSFWLQFGLAWGGAEVR